MTARTLAGLRTSSPGWGYYGAMLWLPLQLAGTLTLLTVGVLLALLLKARFFGIPGLIILLSWFFKYSFALLDAVVAGRYEAPVLSLEMISASLGEFRFLLPLILVIAAFIAGGAGRYFIGVPGTVAIGIVLLACLPLVLAVQGWTGRLSYGLSARSCARMARALGADLFWIIGGTLAVVALTVVVPAYVPSVPTALRIVLALYCWLALIALIGGAVHANRERVAEQIALIIPQELDTTAPDHEQQRQRWLDLIYGAWRANARDQAWSLVAQEMLSQLLRTDREGEALRSFRNRLALDPAFRPRSAAESRRLAELAQRWGDRDCAAALRQSVP